MEQMFAELAGVLDGDKLEALKEAVYLREDTASTYLEGGLAAPHGRIDGLKNEIVVIGVSKDGVDWPESGKKAHLIFLIGVDRKSVASYLSLLQKIIKWKKGYAGNLSQATAEQILRDIKML